MNRNILTAGLLALAAASQISALTLTFNDRGTWASQVTSLVNFDSGSQAPGTATNYYTAAGLALTDLQITGNTVVTSGNTYDLSRVNASAAQPWYQWGTGSILRTGDKTATNTVFARISFPTPVSAFGFNFGAGGASGAPAGVTIAAGGLDPVTINTLQQPTFAFWGAVSDSQTFSFADIYINDTGRYLILDDIARGSFVAPPPVNETAEPGTLFQLALGGILLSMVRNKFSSRERQTI